MMAKSLDRIRAARPSRVRSSRAIAREEPAAFAMLRVLLAEFGRARAAARRYHALRYGSARDEGIAAADIARQVFKEFYSK